MFLRHTKLLRSMSTLFMTAILTFIAIFIVGCTQINSTNEALPSYQNQETVNDTEQIPLSTDNDADSEGNTPLTSFKQVSDYIRQYGKLPNNFITKNEAKELGWIASEGNLATVAPGKSIGGDRFGNREGLLPDAKGRIWYEADINYVSGTRNSDRIVFSNDGLIYMTTDHYKTFVNITEKGSI